MRARSSRKGASRSDTAINTIALSHDRLIYPGLGLGEGSIVLLREAPGRTAAGIASKPQAGDGTNGRICHWKGRGSE
jgi:hypothetical protein